MNRRKKSVKRKIIEYLIYLIIIVSGIILGLYILDKRENKSNFEEEVDIEEKKVKIVDLDSNSRPYAIMINNINVARPLQSGLQDAYIIYEIIVEGGITRYMALFEDQNTDRIGSIRSSRHYFLDYALENDAIYVHHGQSDQALADFTKLDLDRIEVDNDNTGWRDKSLNVSTEHTLFTSIQKLENGLGGIRKQRKNDFLLDYSAESLDLSSKSGAIIANNVVINYSDYSISSYQYDSDNKVYNRFVNGEIHKDYVTGKGYTFKNIITYQVNNYDLNDGSGKGRQGIDNIGSGDGYYISEGYAVPIKWSKNTRESQTIYTYLDGEEIEVNDGNTFIQIQPLGQNITIN